jgi:hypothetical protein
MRLNDSYPQVYNHFTLPNSAHNSYFTPIHDAGATNTLFRQSDSHLLTNTKAGGGQNVGLPNGDVITSKATGTLLTAPVSTEVHVFSDDDLQRSLIATADFCNKGCTAIFTSTSATIIHDATGKIISRSTKEPEARLWPFDLPAQIPTISSNNVVRHEINADFVAYSHASFCSPCDRTMSDALRKGFLGNFPRLTPKMFDSEKPNAEATAKGHLKQTKQKSRKKPAGTKSPPPPPPTYDEAADELAESDFISTQIIRTTDFLNSSDMPGRFPHISYRGYEYMLISVFRGYIHVQLLKNRTMTESVKAYRATYNFFADLGHTPKIQMLDNETSKELNAFFKEVKVVAEYVPPNTHRRNRAERAIQDWKGHLISCLCQIDPGFKIRL